MAARVGWVSAAALVQDLLAAGFLIVGRDAIARAQREAVAQEREGRTERHPTGYYITEAPLKFVNTAQIGAAA